MRTPNSNCCVCGKPLYRKPGLLARVRHVACMEHRSEAQKMSGITEAQRAGLAMGTTLGTNRRDGYKHREESKRKASASHKAWCLRNPDRVKARGEKTRGVLHYNWKGGSSRLNTAIRRLTENRNWMDAVKSRDKVCRICGGCESIESHHIVPLAVLVGVHGITSLDDARACAALWDTANGMAVCARCHYKIHGRKYED